MGFEEPKTGEIVRIGSTFVSVRGVDTVSGTVSVNWYGTVVMFRLRDGWRSVGAKRLHGTGEMMYGVWSDLGRP